MGIDISESDTFNNMDAWEPQTDTSNQARLAPLEEIVPILASPDGGQPVTIKDDGSVLMSADGNAYNIFRGLPILLPSRLNPYIKEGRVEIPHSLVQDPFFQYFFISGVKQNQPSTNCELDDIWWRRHVQRSIYLLEGAEGLLLDIGCDNPKISLQFFSNKVSYVGLDPTFQSTDYFRVIGLGEFLPFRKNSFDCISFATSLDHIFDYHRALKEARRVLKPGGKIYISALLWTKDADLHYDHVHFHHFRDYELLGALQDLGFEIISDNRYNWKNNDHRHSAYIIAK